MRPIIEHNRKRSVMNGSGKAIALQLTVVVIGTPSSTNGSDGTISLDTFTHVGTHFAHVDGDEISLGKLERQRWGNIEYTLRKKKVERKGGRG